MTIKHFVLDTNVLIHNPNSLFSFKEHVVVLPITVIEELDTFKTFSDKKGMHARQVLRNMDRLLYKGVLKQSGAPLNDQGGTLRILLRSEMQIPEDLDQRVKDNQILAAAWTLQQSHKEVFFVTKDVNARIKGEALGIKSRNYEREMVQYDTLYKGWRELVLSGKDFDAFAAEHRIKVTDKTLNDNECVCVKSEANPNASILGRYYGDDSMVAQISGRQEAMGVRPLNLEQRFAFNLLMDDSVKLVSLIGQAGTGKTLMAIACGLDQILGRSKRYEKLLVARPIIPLGKDIGYLPGNKDQKLNYWMQPIFDNLNFLLNKEEGNDEKPKKKQNESDAPSSRQNDRVEYLLDAGLVEIEAITYIRGRSIPNQFIIIDEAQNLTPHEIKTIISRCGEGTKIVLTGDPDQIDNPYLDSNTNGLTYTAERMKGQSLAGHMLLSKSERSELASIAAEVL